MASCSDVHTSFSCVFADEAIVCPSGAMSFLSLPGFFLECTPTLLDLWGRVIVFPAVPSGEVTPGALGGDYSPYPVGIAVTPISPLASFPDTPSYSYNTVALRCVIFEDVFKGLQGYCV